jgi:hypothetical protein
MTTRGGRFPLPGPGSQMHRQPKGAARSSTDRFGQLSLSSLRRSVRICLTFLADQNTLWFHRPGKQRYSGLPWERRV